MARDDIGQIDGRQDVTIENDRCRIDVSFGVFEGATGPERVG